MEFRDSKQHEKAIDYFRQALSVSSDNIQAQVNIARVYMDQKNYEKAVVEFEKALAMDDEEVAARSGLCEAHLALGDAAMLRGRAKEATMSYQRVLAINAEHTEARGRMSELSHQRAEKALQDGKDEEALIAFAEALKYAPEDSSLVERLDQVLAEKKAKKLAALLARAENEANTKNWVSALKSLDEASSLAPDDAAIRKKLIELKALQKKVQLESALGKADMAVKSGSWDEAIETLAAIIAAKPDSALEAKLKELRAKQRQAKLRELNTRAQGSMRTEHFAEALTAWEEYLTLEPDDRENVEIEIIEIKKAQALARSYAEAQKEYAAKNFNQAVTLLKGIIIRDENYKDASRLLAQAIERRRTSHAWWHNKWILRFVSCSLIVGIAWFAFRPGSSLMSMLSTHTPAPAVTEIASGTSTITQATTSTQTVKIRAFADPILSAIADKTPDYQDDFSSPKSGWPTDLNSTGNEYGYQDGAYLISNWYEKMTGGGSCNGVDPPNSRAFSDFVLEVDGKFINQGKGLWAVLFRSNNTAQYGADISPEGMFWFHKNLNGTHIPLPETVTPISSFRTGDVANHFTLIARGNQMAAYVNGEPVGMLTDTSSFQGLFNFTVCNGEPLQVLFDNLKIWDISGITVESSADQIRSFADPIVTSLANRTPDYQDDFSDPNSGWPNSSTPSGDQWGYLNGAYSIKITRSYRNSFGDPCLDIGPNVQPQFPDFVLKANTQFVTDTKGSLHMVFRSMQQTLQNPIDTSYFMGMFLDGTFFFHKNLNKKDQVNQINMVEHPAVPPLLSGTNKNQLMIIAQGGSMAVYANGEPLVLVNDKTSHEASIVLNFGVCKESDTDTPLQVQLDNLKVWNITSLSP